MTYDNTKFDWYADRLLWLKNPSSMPEPQIHDGDIHPGFYRGMRKGKPPMAVAYWRDSHTSELRCQVDGKDVSDDRANYLWTFVAHRPVPSDVYYAVVNDKLSWPDMDAGLSERLAGLALEIPEAGTPRLDAEIAAAEAGVIRYKSIENDDAAAQGQSLRSRLLELKRDADRDWTAEAKPHDDALAEIKSRWKPLVDRATAGANNIRVSLTAWENIKDERRKAENRAQQAAEAKRVAEAASNLPAGEQPITTPTPVAPPAPSAPIRGGYGRAASVKMVTVVTIVDQDKVYAVFRDRQEIKDLLLKMAKRAIDDGYPVDGATSEKKPSVS
jgi:hypothetical protein